MHIARVDRRHADRTVALLQNLRVSMLGIQSRRLHEALVRDGVRGAIDCRIAIAANEVKGVVIAAPASYWRFLPMTRWGIAVECVRARIGRRSTGAAGSRPKDALSNALSLLEPGEPPRSWHAPGDAWRIIFVGTADDARGQGIAAELYRSIMADRSLVARIATGNTPSIRLHHSVGWRLYRDGEVVLAVHLRGRDATPDAQRAAPEPRAAAHREAGPRASGSDRTAVAPRRGS